MRHLYDGKQFGRNTSHRRAMFRNLAANLINHERIVTTETKANAVNDISGSRAILSKRFDQPVNFFCYPAGKYDATTIAEVKQAGYLLATTVHPGLAKPSQPFELRRIRISGGQSLASFAAAVSQH